MCINSVEKKYDSCCMDLFYFFIKGSTSIAFYNKGNVRILLPFGVGYHLQKWDINVYK